MLRRGKLQREAYPLGEDGSQGQGKKKRSQNLTIGTAKFSIVADDMTMIKIKLNGAGRSLLHTAHGRLTAHLAILELAPGPDSTQAKSVQLVQRK